jgi:putative tricarboxylic transport membrane protein
VMGADRAAALLLLVFGVFVIIEARALPYWTGTAPGPGFVPFWLGVLLVCASAALAAKTPRRTVAPLDAGGATHARPSIIVALTAAFALLTLVVGLVVASGIFMAATLTYLRPARTRSNGIAAVATPFAVWLVFVRWLAVPLPAGPFGF